MSTKEQIEKWLKMAPKGLAISEIQVEPINKSVNTVGALTPTILKAGYNVFINGYCKEWED